jgi:hypothetical protein
MIKKTAWGIVCMAVMFLSNGVRAQFTIRCEQDTILAGEGEAKIDFAPAKANSGFSCVARKGGGSFTEFKQVETPKGTVSQSIFSSPFPGEVEIEVIDAKFVKIGKAILVVVSPTVQILEQESLDKFNGGAKTMPLYVKVLDQRGQLVKTAKLICRLSEIVGKKNVATASKVSEFVLREDYYEAEISALRDASYKVEVIDLNHLEAFDKSENPDEAHPSAVIEGLNISVH